MGNARVSFGRTSAGALEIVDSNDYYPFGMNHLKTGNAYFGAGSYKAYKFQEQELQETGFYSFKWRQYMPDVARFFNIDPLAEKYPTWAPYVFSGNRVVDARELEGLEPHVLFNTRENAAANFGQQYNGKSILNKQEIGALIYFKYVDGKKYYAYNNPTTGDAHGIPQGLNMKLPKGAAASAYIHAHGNEDKEYDDENFSGDPSGGGDKGVANDLGLDGFLVTPGGLLKYYDLSSNTEKILRTNMPSDPNSPERKNKNNPVENPNPSSGDYRSKPFPNLKPIPDDRPKPIIDGGFKSIENNKKNHQPPLIDLSHLPYHR
ncbi:RHS repeat-associated protein [Chryseobacterium lathyri]|uniref:RHS repeat-associated protein n=1 Tax=Chryseobacterium lathyri TaxID=395933 RepID=A0ABT9SNK1_9FLAO|nr:RHS repeat-associated protein [Chryseobacterium lathyri]